jgi:DNA replication protein DnaC
MDLELKGVLPESPVKICRIHSIRKEFTGTEDYKILVCPKCVEEGERKKPLKSVDPEAVRELLEKSCIPEIYKNVEFEPETTEQEQAKDAAYELLGDVNCGVFIGKLGTGKTLMACNIVDSFIKKYQQPAVYSKFFRLISEIKDSWNTKTPTLNVVDRYVKPYLLVIDEVGMGFGSETELIYISQIIDDRYTAGKKTILCGNVDRSELKKVIGDKAYRRIVDNYVLIAFNWDRYTSKSGDSTEK